MVTTAPLTEIGSVDMVPGWGAFSTVTQDATEPVSWVGQQRVVTVNRMRVDAQVDSLCSSLVMPIMRMKWELNPNGARDEIVEQISTDLGIPVKGSVVSTSRSRRRFKHRDHLEHSLLALWYGHMFFEQVPDTENFDLATDGWRLRKLAPRMPSSIDTIHTARDGGLAGITQVGYRGSVSPTRRQGLSLVTTSEPQIPVGSLAAYVWKREGSNWSGRSMLRPLYRDWVLKDRALRVDSIKNERFGMGIPTATAPVGGDPAQYAKLAQSIRASEFGGVGLENGAGVGIEGIRGTLPDIMESIRYYDESMARSFMAMVIQLGQTQTGSRALGETFADFFQMLVEAVANWYRDTTNEHVIEDLVDWNFGEDEQAPLLEWSYPQGEQMLAISEMVSMVQAGVITMDRETEQALRQRTRLPLLPEIDDAGAVEDAANSPFADVGLPALVEAFILSPEEARELLGVTGPAPTPSQVEAFVAARRPGLTRGQVRAAVTASKQMIGGGPPFGHRQPNKFELAAGTDFDTLQTNWEESTKDLVADWRSQVQAGQIDEIVEQVRTAVEANDLVALTDLQASTAGVDLLKERLLELAEDAIVGAREEALSQGVDIGTLNTKAAVEPLVTQRAEATANLLSRGISESASRFASNLGAGLASDEVAASVREHLEGLSDAYLNDMLGGAMTQAQNTGRKAVMSERPSVIYASELLDGNTCSRCAEIDGMEFSSLAAAEEEYPTGGHKRCLGGPRCRGTLVAVYLEGDAAPEPEPRPEPEQSPEPEPGEPFADGPLIKPEAVQSRQDLEVIANAEVLPPDTDEFEHFYHSTRTSSDVESIVENGLNPGGGATRVWLSKDEIRDRNGGYVVVRVPRGLAKEGIDHVESGLTYREWTVPSVPSDNILRGIRMVEDSTGFAIREDRLARFALDNPLSKDAADLPDAYQKWFGLPDAPEFNIAPFDGIEPVKVMDPSLNKWDEDWRSNPDPAIRGAALWQWEMESMSNIRHIESNLRRGVDPLDGVQIEERLKKVFERSLDADADIVQVFTEEQLSQELVNAAQGLKNAVDAAEPNDIALFKGMRVEDPSQFVVGQTIDLDMSSFSSDLKEATQYSADPVVFKPEHANQSQVIVHLEPGARSVPLRDMQSGKMKASNEHIVRDKIKIDRVETDGEITNVYVRQQ